jgi:nitronate monooxygenase
MKTLTTALCQRLGMEHPIIQAPMGVVVSAEMVSGVCNAGGLGMIAGTWISARDLSQQIRSVAQATKRQFGVNLVLAEKIDDNLNLALDAGVRIISFFWGDPAPYIEKVHSAGALVMQTVGSAREARRVVDSGVDVIVAQGIEAGGHVFGDVATMALVPAVVDAVPGIPVVAAGGIGDGRGVVAALALGAQAAWMGTRFLLAEESLIHPEYRRLLIEATEADTLRSKTFDGGWTDAFHRCLVNETSNAWVAAGLPPAGSRPNEGKIVGHHSNGVPIPIYDSFEPVLSTTGDIGAMALYAGQSVAQATRTQPVAEIVRAIVDEMDATVRRL